MEIKDENINKLMTYFDEMKEVAERASGEYHKMFKEGIINKDTFCDGVRDAMRLSQEHDKIRRILFGTEEGHLRFVE